MIESTGPAPAWGSDWLVGAGTGLYCGRPGGTWDAAGPYEYRVTCVRRSGSRLAVGTDGGLWEPRPAPGLWRQLHDEVLTVVQDVAFTAGDPGMVVASIYGVHVAERDELGVCRWRSCSGGLPVDARASAAILVDGSDPQRWIVGTEAGVLVAADGGARWETASLTGTAVRALLKVGDRYWAGTDGRGVWRSDDALTWHPARAALEAPVFSLSPMADGRLLAGTGRGVMWGDGESAWRPSGPSVWAAAVGADPVEPGTWVAGASLGGVWWTADGGGSWHQVTGITRGAEAVSAPLVPQGGR
ncbi:MAG: hypothetical protein ABIL09_21620 [Gemmatimonadota bacterium]